MIIIRGALSSWGIFILQLIYKLRPAVQIVLLTVTTAMDNLKIHDSQLNRRPNLTLRHFLERKADTRLPIKSSRNSRDTCTGDEPLSKLLPTYTFTITAYQITEHVEYTVLLQEQYTILRRKIVKQHTFVTRYSMLEALDRKIGGMGLPGKKIFGNKKRQFVEKRKKELQLYLNRVAQCGEVEFYRFIKQIQDVSFNESLNQTFKLP